MTCPKCGSYQHHVYDSRYTHEGQGKYRRRVCLDCGYHWGSQEVPIEDYKRLVRYKEICENLSTAAKEIVQTVEGRALNDKGTA